MVAASATSFSLDLDLATAKEESKENPVYYTQYAFARISSVFAKAEAAGIELEKECSVEALAPLTEKEEMVLIKTLNEYPEAIKRAAELYEPHHLTYYILDLSAKLHRFYYHHRVLVDDVNLSKGRLYLLQAVYRVLKDGLSLLGVHTPKSM